MVPDHDNHRFERIRPLGAIPPGTLISHYEIIEEIGAGGMGVVYKAEDTELHRMVALKFLSPQAIRSEENMARFIREAQSAAALDHPNICTIHEIGKAQGHTFIVMAYIEGQSLKERIEAGALELDDALDVAVQVAKGLKAAHDKGIVHRDIKPANIMITSDGTVKIMDFGIATSAGETRLTGVDETLGTVPYMSPEHCGGEEVDHRTDIWSLGVVLYEMLTGVPPFAGGIDQAIIYSILNEAPKPVSELRTDAPPWLEQIVGKALVKNRDERYQRVGDLIADIQHQAVRPRRQVSLRTIVMIVAAIGLAIGITAVISRRPRLVTEPEKIYLAFLPFENRTGEPELDWMISGIPDNLTADLAQSRFFRVMSLERLHQVFSDIGKDLEEVGTAEAMNLLGRATDLDAVAVGSFVKAGGEIRITMKIENPQDQEVMGSAIVDDAESHLLDLIDQLTVETKQIFKLSQEDIDGDLDRGVGLQRTRSVKAASEFSKGLEHSYAGAFLDAADAFGEAVEADPDFAMAYAKASEAYKNLGYDEKAESLSLIAVDKVIEFRDRVPPADRTFILANHADLISNIDQAIESYKEFTEAYPDNPEGYYKLGLIYESISEWDLAVENFRRTLDLDPKFGAARFELSKVLIRRDDLEPALIELRHLLGYYRDIGNREGEATVLNAIGVVHRHKNEFEQAVTYFEISIAIKEELGDKRGIAASLGNLGLIYKTTGDMDRALDALQRSLEIKREIGDKLGISTALNKIGQICQWDCRYEEALSYFERAYEIRKDLGAKQMMASSLSDMATIIHTWTGNYEKAFELDSTALALRREIGDDRGTVLSLGNIAVGLSSRGHFEEASAKLMEGLAIARDLDDQRQIAALSYQLGHDCVSRGKVDSAMIYYSEVLDVFEALDVKPQIATTLASMAFAYQLRGEYTKALAGFDRARHLSEATGNRFEVVNALLGKAGFFIELGYRAGCDSILAELDSYSAEALSYGQSWELKLQKARRLHAGGDLSPARDLAGETAADTRLTELKIEAILLLAEITFEQGSVAEAVGKVNRAIEEAQKHSFRRHEAEGLRLRARILSNEGKTGDAARICDDALGIAAGLGVDQYDFLISCGDMRLANGENSKALSFYMRGLNGAAAVVKDKCPTWLGTHYIKQKRIGHYARLVEDLSVRTEDSVRPPDYKAVFGLE